MIQKHTAAPLPSNNTNTQPVLEFLFGAPVQPLDPTQDTARYFFKLGFNVFPIPFAKKGGWPWKAFQYTRLHPDNLLLLFTAPCNLAVMTGRTSGNLFVIDCETPERYRQQGQALKQAGIPRWSVRTGGGGGHYYLRCIDGEVANIPSGNLPDMEIRGNRCYVLVPPSVHPRTGVLYEWDRREGSSPPQVSLQDIDFLPLELATRTRQKSQAAPIAFAELSTRTRDFIENGAAPGERNIRLFAAACDMAGNQYEDFAAHRILQPAALGCGLSQQEIDTTLRSAFSRSREPSRKTQPVRRFAAWERAIAWAEQQVWPGRTGQTDRAVFLACCERARVGSNDKGTFRASTRELAELARTGRETVSRALTRLLEAHLLEPRGNDHTSQARLWKLGIKTTQYTPLTETSAAARNTPTKPTWSGKGGLVSHSDAAESGALGKTGALVYEALVDCREPIMPLALARQMKLSRDQVQRAVKKLAGFQLARREKTGWVAIARDAVWLDEHVAAPAGTLGKGEARKRKHAEERAKRAGEMVLRARIYEERRQRMAQEKPPPVEVKLPVAHGEPEVMYCQNCGQSTFVFAGDEPPQVCEFCTENYGWKEGSVWLTAPPEPPPGVDRHKKRPDKG